MEENNKRIFKNTAYLYVRQLVIMGLSFFTTRIVLEKLGADDFGVNNVVAGSEMCIRDSLTFLVSKSW